MTLSGSRRDGRVKVTRTGRWLSRSTRSCACYYYVYAALSNDLTGGGVSAPFKLFISLNEIDPCFQPPG